MEDNSVLLEDSNAEEFAGPRKSLSQPSLAVKEVGADSTETTPKHGMNNAYSASNVRSIPIIQTWHENEELKGQMYSLRCEVQMHQRKYLEAKEACHKSVQEVLDDYVLLRCAQDEMDEKNRQFEQMQKSFREMQEKLDDSKDRQVSLERQASEFEVQRRSMEQKIRDLEAALADGNNTTFGSFRGTLDDILKKDDPNYTITSDEDRKIQELEYLLASARDRISELEEQVGNMRQDLDDQSARLASSENLRAQLEAAAGQGILGAAGASIPNATFVIGNARESQTEEQLKYIDELEKQATKANNEYERARLALVEYMNRCSKLENDLHALRKNSTFDSSSILIAGKSSEDLKAQIDKVNGELNTLRAENRELRIRCDQLTGGDGNVSISLGESRLMAGISATNLDASAPIENETGGTSMRIQPRGSSLGDPQESQILEDSQLPLMDTTAEKNNKAEFDMMWAEFESEQHKLKDIPNDTIESSFNSSMPPPDRDATQSFLSQKGYKNSPLMIPKVQSLQYQLQAARQANMNQEPIQNTSFSSKATSAMVASPSIPILQDVQQILDSSAILLEGQHDAAVNVEKMQEKMTLIRDALTRLFERLKSSAALFEDILEKMGSSSPLADRIKQMKLAFETSMCDHADVSNFLEAAEKDLTNMSLNFSVLEKSVVSQSFVADMSRRFTIAPGAEDIASSSLLNASYSPIFKFSNNHSTEVEQLKKEVADLKSELDKAHARELYSPLQSSPSRLSDVQIKAAQNFEELEVCQATLKKVEGEKAALAHELAEIDASNHHLSNKISELRQELENALSRIAVEHSDRESLEIALRDTNSLVAALKKDAAEQGNAVVAEMERRVAETRTQVQEQNRLIVEQLKHELSISLSEENKIRDFMEEMKMDMERLKRRTNEAEAKVELAAGERQQLIEQIVDLEDKLEKLSDFEKESTDYAAKIASRKKELELVKQREEIEKEALEGLERIRKEMSELTKKNMKTPIIKGNATSIRMVCDELCRRVSQERSRQHEYAETMKSVNDKIEQLTLQQPTASSEKENAPPLPSAQREQVVPLSQKSSSSKFVCPTRQLLHESTMAVDAIVQKLKKTHAMQGMGVELKETVANVITESRNLRDFLHQKLNLFKGIDVTNWRNETVEQLLERIERCYQDIAILEEENRNFKKEVKQMKAAIPTLGADVKERIKREIGGIAQDMGAVKGLRKK